MKDRFGVFDIRIGDHFDCDQRPYPVVALEILEEEGLVRFIDNEGIEDFGKPGRFALKYQLPGR